MESFFGNTSYNLRPPLGNTTRSYRFLANRGKVQIKNPPNEYKKLYN